MREAKNKKKSRKTELERQQKKNVKQQICLPCPGCDLPRGQVKNAWRAQFTVETGAVLLAAGRGRVLCKTTPKKGMLSGGCF